MSTGSPPSRCSKPRPSADQIADRLDGGAWRGLELCLARQHVASDGGRCDEAIARLRRALGVARHRRGARRVAERRVRARRPARRRGARAASSAAPRFAAGIGSPVLTIHLFVPLSPEEFRAAGPVDEGAVEEFLRFYADACASRGRHAADRERPADPAHAHGRRLPLAGRRPLARPARMARARARARLHLRHLARRAVPLLRGRVPVALRARLRRGARARALRRGARARPPRSRTSPTRTACSARACPTAPASSTSTPSCAGSASSSPSSSRRSTSPTRRARVDMKAGYRAIERALARARRRRARAAAPAPGRGLRLAGRHRAAATRSRPCSSCRSASAAGAC